MLHIHYLEAHLELFNIFCQYAQISIYLTVAFFRQQAADVRRQVSGSTISSTPSNDGSRIAGSKYNSSHGSVVIVFYNAVF